KGEILDTNGNILGYHEGTAKYTIGQRKGLGVSSNRPLFVVDIVEENNQIILGSNDDLFSKELIASNCNWISGEYPKKEYTVKAKIRYKAQEQEATIFPLSEEEIRVVFTKPQRAITKGQSIVFYDKDYILGGGIISEVN
ncbi:MAG TPA: tRNA 2-thiouridine(34) synthase MnmA, partial [Candidatus Dojkabacteria bacterium]|nr:tRNA 2-thiouridine(34) synthase MnmA [Candidatus Dojkabacteria bacterium]